LIYVEVKKALVSGKIFFITCNLLRTRLKFNDSDFECLAEAVRQVRNRRAFLLAGYTLMRNHWHALIAPTHVPRLQIPKQNPPVKLINRPDGLLIK
jgi:REP element-mobilizing transposase RayT